MTPPCSPLVVFGVVFAGACCFALLVSASEQAARVKPQIGAPPPPTTTTSNSQFTTVKVNFTDCGPKNIKEVRITPCPGDGTVCNINLGTNITVEADFVAKHDTNALAEVIKGVVRGRELQFPEQRSDPCKSTISPACPIKAGKLYQYKAAFEVKPHYPAIAVKVRYALMAAGTSDVVACVQIAAKIIDPAPSVRSLRLKDKKKHA